MAIAGVALRSGLELLGIQTQRSFQRFGLFCWGAWLDRGARSCWELPGEPVPMTDSSLWESPWSPFLQLELLVRSSFGLRFFSTEEKQIELRFWFDVETRLDMPTYPTYPVTFQFGCPRMESMSFF